MIHWKEIILVLSLATVITDQYRDPNRRKYYHSYRALHWPTSHEWNRERNPIMDEFLSEINEDIARRYNMVEESNSKFGSSNSYTTVPATCKILYNNGGRRPLCDNPYPENAVFMIKPEYHPIRMPRKDYTHQEIPILCRRLIGARRCKLHGKPKKMKVNVYVLDDKGRAVKINEQIAVVAGNEVNVLLTLDPSQWSVNKSSEPLKIDGEENKSDVQKELPEMRMNLAKEHFPVESKSSSAKPTADATLQGETLLATAALKLNKTTENESPQLVKKEDVEDGQKPVMKEAKKDEEIKCKDTLKEDNAEKREKGEDKPKKEEKQHKTRNAEVKTKKQEEETQKEKQNDQKDEKKKKTKTKKKREKNKRSPKDS